MRTTAETRLVQLEKLLAAGVELLPYNGFASLPTAPAAVQDRLKFTELLRPETNLAIADHAEFSMFRRLKRSVSKRLALASLPTIARQVMDERLTYLSAVRMASLLKEIRRVNSQHIDGDFVEFGMALGGSAIVIADSRQGRRFVGYDLFGQIPSPGPRDRQDAHSRYEIIAAGKSTGLGGQTYYGYEPDLYSKVVGSFARYGLKVDQRDILFHKGLFEETFSTNSDTKIALAHIDCDWYDPVYFCMKKISPILTTGGVVLVDDFNDYAGCHDAVIEALNEDKTLVIERTLPHAVIRKI